jgi:hypothetical protein
MDNCSTTSDQSQMDNSIGGSKRKASDSVDNDDADDAEADDDGNDKKKKKKKKKKTSNINNRDDMLASIRAFVAYNIHNPRALYHPNARFLLDHIRDDVVPSLRWTAHLSNRAALQQGVSGVLRRPETANGELSCGTPRVGFGRAVVGSAGGKNAVPTDVANGDTVSQVVPARDIFLTKNAFKDIVNRPDPNKDRTFPVVMVTGAVAYDGGRFDERPDQKNKNKSAHQMPAKSMSSQTIRKQSE